MAWHMWLTWKTANGLAKQAVLPPHAAEAVA
jgi:hypothetical protein